MILDNVKFINNKVDEDRGGGLALLDFSPLMVALNLQITNSLFSGNIAFDFGSAIYIDFSLVFM